MRIWWSGCVVVATGAGGASARPDLCRVLEQDRIHAALDLKRELGDEEDAGVPAVDRRTARQKLADEQVRCPGDLSFRSASPTPPSRRRVPDAAAPPRADPSFPLVRLVSCAATSGR